jgi:hypothetical protein
LLVNPQKADMKKTLFIVGIAFMLIATQASATIISSSFGIETTTQDGNKTKKDCCKKKEKGKCCEMKKDSTQHCSKDAKGKCDKSKKGDCKKSETPKESKPAPAQ